MYSKTVALNILKAEKLAEAALMQHKNDQEVLAIVSLVAVTMQK